VANREALYRGKRIVILGLARQGVALAQYLAAQGARVVVSDLQPATSPQLAANLAALSSLTIEYVLGAHPLSLLDGADSLCLSGGVSADLPIAQEALRRHIRLTNDTQIFLEACPAGVLTVGITGSAGKTTTTTLAGQMLARTLPGGGRANRAVWVGGNIGNPLIADVHRMQPGDAAVMELSSFQLEIATLSTQVAAVLNITPNHLDRHGTMEAYTAAKSRLLLNQPAGSVAILGQDDPGARGLAPLVRGRLAYFSGLSPVEEGACLRGEAVMVRWDGREHEVCAVKDIRLRGWHNVVNVLAACAISAAAGAAPEAMRAAIADFTGVEHRLELVVERGGVKWYNDSIASAPERVMAAVRSFDEPLVLLLGGRDKKLPWEALAQLAKARVKYLVLFGEARTLIQNALEAAGVAPDRYAVCARLAEAVGVAARRAERGDVVLLSPGCTSFDEFQDFAERGDKFREWVQAL
jgi:UDP-N-acetylmuramoylalanine--D-glutamate ligase